MAIDPKAAAAAAQAAADAARAAAEAAAKAADEAAAAGTTDANVGAKLPTLATSATREVLDDTGVTLGGVMAEDLGGATDLGAIQEGLLGDSGRESLLDLPDLQSGGVGLTSPLPSLGSSFNSSGGDIGKSSIMSDPNLTAALNSTPFYSDGGADAGTSDAGPATKLDPIVKINTDGTVERINDDGVYHDDGGVRPGDDLTTTKDVKTDEVEGGAVKGGDVGVWDVIKGIFGFGSDDDADAGADGGTTGTDGGTTGADAGGGTDVPPGEQEVVLPPGWVNPDDLDFVDDDRKTGGIVAGGTGRDPDGDGGDATTPGPQGGDWAINPGAEGFVAGRETDLRDAKEWYGGVSQPGDPTLEPVSGNPAMLDQGIQVVDPNTVNPSGGEGTTSDGEAQASTAYRAMESAPQDGIESTEEADIANTGYESDATMPVDDSGGELTGATAESDGASSEDRASPFSMPVVDDDARHGQGHGYGRDAEKGSHGRGRDGQDDDQE